MSGGHDVRFPEASPTNLAHEDVRRESGDPTTPGERLRELLVQVATWGLLQPERIADLAWLEESVLVNPALPLDLLGHVLHLPPTHRWPRIAWYNPTVSLLLVRDPLLSYPLAARLLLAHLSGIPDSPVPLASLVRLWSQRATDMDLEKVPARTLARHFSALFALPCSG